MRSPSRLLAMLVLPGCAQLAGIDPTTDERAGVSLAYERVSIGATVIRSPLDLSTETATYLTATGPVAATVSEPGKWTADLRAQTPPVLFTLPTADPAVHTTQLWTFPNANLTGELTVLEHPSPIAPPVDSKITATITLDAPYAGELIRLYDVGAWCYRDFGAAEIPIDAQSFGPIDVPFATFNSLSGRPLEKITTADAMVALRYVGNELVGAGEIMPFDQTGADTITATMATGLRDRTLEMNVDPAATSARFGGARPAVTVAGANWAIYATPAYESISTAGPLLQAAGIATTDAPSTITATYSNPFTRDWRAVLETMTVASRQYTPPTLALPVTLSAMLIQRQVEPTAAFDAKFPVGLPERVTINGTSLSTDGVSIAAPTAEVEIAFETDVPTASLYQVQIAELGLSMDGTTVVRTPILTATALEATFHIPADRFVAGKLYTIRTVAIAGGYPDVATGDLRLHGASLAVGALDSGVFEVKP